MTQNLTSFMELGLSVLLLKALQDLNFVSPSPIQQQTIPWFLQGRDLIGQAQTGTGKTAAFALPILEQIDAGLTKPQALILAPTRELAIQVAEQFEILSKYLPAINIAVLCGGQDYRPQLKKLRDGVQIVVGTPGRILDHLNRGSLQLDNLRTFILDEADEMLRMGFIEDVETILSKLPETRQVGLFSATMPTKIRQIAHQYLSDPVTVEIKMATATVKSIEQKFLFSAQNQKPGSLLRVLAAEDYQGVIIFVRTKNSTEEVAQLLQENAYRAMAIHGDLSQPLRERIIAQFKQGVIDILVATDVAARGLDVERVTHVINYDIAQDCETYVHRIGRTGRAGRSGSTILFVTPKESRMLNMIERHTKQKIEKMLVPNDFAIQTAKQKRFLTKITERFQHEHLGPYRKMIEEHANNTGATLLDVASSLALLLHHDQPWQTKLDFPVAAEAREDKKSRKNEFESKGKLKFKGESRFERRPKFESNLEDASSQQELFRLDVGRVHGVKPANIVGAIANEAGLQSRFITNLKIHDDHSTVRLPKGMPKEVRKDLTKTWVCGRQLKLTSMGG